MLDILKGKIQIPAYRALYLDKILEKNEHFYVERDKHFKSLIKEFKAIEDSDFEVPASLKKRAAMHGSRWKPPSFCLRALSALTAAASTSPRKPTLLTVGLTPVPPTLPL